ncbi:AraC family transcriptional regulator [Phenylobacterium montanum]|uniref:AraC family transcriptional regulator n=1 Tax=Phenylobacterium montanum TaxID=2823693 RepID=A0A975G2P5_9CAUL|nr:AraC family transcriptional regulator [Caulobacter sp. S6]QUD89382.1 AraC family transcriptional regulator [Caulobacter sp. S6]
MSVREIESTTKSGRPVSLRQRFLRAGILRAFVEAANLLSLDWAGLMRSAGIDPVVLDDQETRVPAAAVAQLLHLGVEASGRRDLPLVIAEVFQPSMLGPPVLWALRQATVAEGLEVYEDRLKSRNNSLLIKVERKGDLVLFQPLILDPELRNDSLDQDLVMGMCLRLLRWLLGEGWWPQTAYFSCPRPQDVSAHRRLFGEVVFDHGFSGMAIDAADLERPIQAADPGVMAVIQRHALANARSGGASAVDVMSEMIARLLPTGHCGIDQAAQRQGVDRRTIHRRLAAEGCSFTDLVERVRRELIAEEMSDQSRSLTRIAELLGFSSLSTFSRWHRHAYGVAARDVRKGRHPDLANAPRSSAA